MLSGCVWWLMKGRGRVGVYCTIRVYAAMMCLQLPKSVTVVIRRKRSCWLYPFSVIFEWVFDKASNQLVVTVYIIGRMEETDEDQGRHYRSL